MSTKAALKAAKSAIDAKKWDEAIEHANTVLEKDPKNYFAKLFTGRAQDGLGRLESAAQAYHDATKLKPQDTQAWLGLRALYQKQGPTKVDERIDVELQLAQIYAELCVLFGIEMVALLTKIATTHTKRNRPSTVSSITLGDTAQSHSMPALCPHSCLPLPSTPTLRAASRIPP